MIYGTKLKEVGKEFITDKCPNCGTQNCINIHVFQKYAHVFWIPAFPLRKTAVSQCDHCKQVLKLKDMPANMKASYETFKKQLKTPIWMFSGLAIFVGLFAYALIADKRKNDRNEKWIQTPLAGDVYEVRLENNKFSLFKINEIKNDSVFLKVHLFETNTVAGLKDLRKKGEDAYSENSYGYSTIELKDMFQKGEILNVER